MSNLKNIVYGDIHAGGNVHIGDTTYINTYFVAQEVKIPHRLTNNIPTHADHILGRAAELKRVNDHLAHNEATILFNGIGGIGKTALATKYMAVYGSDYKHLAWITVQSTLAEAFTNNAPLLASLHITQQVQDYISAKQLDKAFAFLFHQLNLLERTLVVIDNANNLDDLEKYKNEFDNAQCHFLITSRSKPSEWTTVDVDSLPEDEAVSLFRKLHPSVSATDEAIKSLLSKLFYHTLLIELVAKAGATGIPFADLQTMIETQFIHHKGLNERVIPKGKHGNFVPVEDRKAKIEEYIWLIFKQVKGLEEDSKQLLKAMALLPVATPFGFDFLKEHFTFFDIPNSAVHLDALIERGWLQKEQAEGQKPYFKMHPLIADVVVEHLEVDVIFGEKQVIKIAALIQYDNSIPSDDINKKCQYLLFAERLGKLFFNAENESVCDLLNCLCWYNQQFSFYEKAKHYGKQSLKLAKNIQNPTYNILSTTQSILALVFQDLGNNGEAAVLLENALRNNKNLFGAKHIVVADNQTNLANAYNSLERYEESFDLFKNAIEIYKNEFDYNHAKVIMALTGIASIYQKVERHDEAVYLLEITLEAKKIIFGVEHPNIALEQIKLSESYLALKRFDEAIDLLKQALVFCEIFFGQKHLHTAKSQILLATAYYDLGQKKEAHELWIKACQTRATIYGEDHKFTVHTKNMFNF